MIGLKAKKEQNIITDESMPFEQVGVLAVELISSRGMKVCAFGVAFNAIVTYFRMLLAEEQDPGDMAEWQTHWT